MFETLPARGTAVIVKNQLRFNIFAIYKIILLNFWALSLKIQILLLTNLIYKLDEIRILP